MNSGAWVLVRGLSSLLTKEIAYEIWYDRCRKTYGALADRVITQPASATGLLLYRSRGESSITSLAPATGWCLIYYSNKLNIGCVCTVLTIILAPTVPLRSKTYRISNQCQIFAVFTVCSCWVGCTCWYSTGQAKSIIFLNWLFLFKEPKNGTLQNKSPRKSVQPQIYCPGVENPTNWFLLIIWFQSWPLIAWKKSGWGDRNHTSESSCDGDMCDGMARIT